jgi:hypothetical protein
MSCRGPPADGFAPSVLSIAMKSISGSSESSATVPGGAMMPRSGWVMTVLPVVPGRPITATGRTVPTSPGLRRAI